MPKNTSLNWGAAWLMALACSVSAGCDDETGILVEVTRDEATTSAAIDELRFFIGSRAGTALFVEDAVPLQTVELPGGRDLLANPYRLLMRDGANDTDGSAANVMVAVIGYVGGEVNAFGHFDSAVQFQAGEVRQWPVVLRGSVDISVTDTGCLVYGGGKIAPNDDQDCDGDRAPADCNDQNPDVGPSSQELCNNTVDDNCDMTIDEEVDADDDGFTNCDECDDGDRFVNPDAEEVCDGIDNDCDGTCDAEFDVDDDGYSSCGSKLLEEATECLAPESERIDCNDERDDVFPGADEVCDGADNDCNDVCDDGFDTDEDDYTVCGSNVETCDGTDPKDVDCKPEDGDIYPHAPERCNGVDDNCDELRYPATVSCYGTATTGGGGEVCVVGVRACDDTDEGSGWGECDTEGRADDEAFRAPPELCSAYATCEAEEEPNPFECAGEIAATLAVPCTLHVAAPGEGALCPRTVAPVPVPDKVGCSWTILGGKAQRHYVVGLSSLESLDTLPTGGGAGAIDACAIWFQVIEARGTPPLHDSVLLWHHDVADPAGVLIEVQLTPAPAAVCPEVGLDCAAFPDLSADG